MKNNFKRIVSVSAAAVCMISALRIAPIASENAEAAGVMTPFEITEDIKIGWNLGNSLDATVDLKKNPDPSPADTEKAWGNPVTTQEMINTVKAKGFNAVRVPTTWFQHLDENNNIDTDYLDRVQEVVDYAYKQGMYVILNVHHEEWVNRPDLGTAYEEMSAKLTAIWRQVATRFADYDQHLIFEGMNEPRAAGTTHEWYGPLASEVDTINKLDQDFVDTVRSVESPYKDTRLLMVPPYCATSDQGMYSKLIVPDDDFICVSLHAYAPYDFVMNKDVTDHTQFLPSYAKSLENTLKSMRDFYLDKDIPVIIGEFSSSNYDNTEARCDWATTYLTTAKKFGLPCFLWDNNVDVNPGDPAEAHGYLDRANLKWYSASEPVIDTMMKILDDDSIKWGCERKAPVYIHPAIESGKEFYDFDGGMKIDVAVEDGNCAGPYDMAPANFKGKDIAVKFGGETPVLAFMDDEWNNWTEFKPYQVDEKTSIAYFNGDDVIESWSAAGDPVHAMLRTNSQTTIYKVYIIDQAVIGTAEDATKPTEPTTIDPNFKFETLTYPANLPERSADSKTTATLKISGVAKASVGGCVGYTIGEDWNAVEWKTDLDADGKATINVDVSSIPVDISKVQIQIWWSNVNEVDKPCKLSDYKFDVTGGTATQPTQPTTTPSPTVDEAKYSFDDLKTTKDGWVLPLVQGKEIDKIVIELESSCSVDVDWYCGGGAVSFSQLVNDESAKPFWGAVPFQYNKGEKSVTVKFNGEFQDADEKMVSAKITDKEAVVQDWWTAAAADDAAVTVNYKNITVYYKESAEPTTTTTTLIPEPTTTTTTIATAPSTTPDETDILFGDANGDGIVTVADAVAIMSYVTNPDTYAISDAAVKACDVYNRGDGINNMDALSVQKFVAQLILTLPESVG